MRLYYIHVNILCKMRYSRQEHIGSTVRHTHLIIVAQNYVLLKINIEIDILNSTSYSWWRSFKY